MSNITQEPENVATIDLPQVSLNSVEDILVNANGTTGRITKENFLGAVNDWSAIINKPFDDFEQKYFRTSKRGDGAYLFTLSDTAASSLNKIPSLSLATTNNTNKTNTLEKNVSSNVIKTRNNANEIAELKKISHTHSNKETVDKFSVDTDGRLLWDTQPIDGGINFEEITRMLTTGTLTNISITPDSEQKVFNIEVSGLKDISIDENKEWVIDGEKTGISAMGVDGYSPVANVTTEENVSTITITDKSGTTTAQVVSPTFSWNKTEFGVDFVISDVNGSHGVSLAGQSPTVSAEETATGYDLIVNDVTGTKVYKLYNGKDGKDGKDGITTVVSQKQFFNATFTADGWQGTNAPYTQTIALEAMTEELNPIVDLVVSDVVAVGLAEEQNYNYITKITTGNQSLTAYCYKDKPTVDLNIIVEVN